MQIRSWKYQVWDLWKIQHGIRAEGLQDNKLWFKFFDQEDQETKKEDTKDVGEDNAWSEPTDMDTKTNWWEFCCDHSRQQNKKETFVEAASFDKFW